MVIYNVILINNNPGSDPRPSTASFSSREKADEFLQRMRKAIGDSADWHVDWDSVEIDDTFLLDAIAFDIATKRQFY